MSNIEPTMAIPARTSRKPTVNFLEGDVEACNTITQLTKSGGTIAERRQPSKTNQVLVFVVHLTASFGLLAILARANRFQ